MHHKIIIRDFSQNDMASAVDILQSVSAYSPEVDRFNELATNFLNNQSVYSCVAVCNGFTVGVGSIFVLKRMRGGVAGVIEDVAVQKDVRGRGVGRLILSKLLEHAKAKSCFKVTLVCSNENISFYEKIGFKQDYKSMKIML